VRLDYLLYPTGRGVAQVEVWWWVACDNCAGLSGSRGGGGLGSQPCVDTRLKSASCTVERYWLPVREVDSVVDPGGTARLNVLVGNGTGSQSVTLGVAEGAQFRARTKEGGGGSCTCRRCGWSRCGCCGWRAPHLRRWRGWSLIQVGGGGVDLISSWPRNA